MGKRKQRQRATLHAVPDRRRYDGEELDLGEMGVAAPQVRIRFTWFGAKIRVNPELSELDMYDFMQAGQEVDVEDPKSMTMVKDYILDHIHPDDRVEFWRLAKANRQDTQDLLVLSRTLLEKILARPTGPASDSSDGRPDTRPKSGPGASLRAAGEQHIRRLDAEGRPDLALQVVAAMEARERATG